MGTKRARGTMRLLAVTTGLLLVGALGAGPAFAQDGDGTGTGSGSETSSTGSLLDVTGTTLTTPTLTTPVTGTTTTTGTSTTTGTGTSTQVLCSQLETAYNSLRQQATNLTTQLQSLPPGPLQTAVQGQLDTVNASIDTVSQQLIAQGCSITIPTGTGTSTGTGTGTSTSTGTGTGISQDCYFYSDCTVTTPSTVASTIPATTGATQVSSVPTGGVNTGDGSY